MSDPVKTFVEVWGGSHLAADIADKLTCNEAEAIASLFLGLGDVESADFWIEHHADSDDCDDDHCRCEDCKENG
ncbi:hypothetical protein SEA_SUPERCALLIE99_78 [Mycobacterium phage SuperCallie99]|uniref:Uncharacterized protein n=3 Tax=Gladiatorvirus ericB TaxID=1041406 RepID=A0A7G9A1E3_9CAUD|nr:hypothetical protein AXJ19_gp031 [Mycobacterium phage VohminGhazi]YP_009637884.1 hypothetical protein FGG32_gp029 [Mycobacterium phage EricB]AEK08522.1 hypothetical protein PBI_DAVINCI_79 [Mycobacterium phage DaVinci]AMQ66915.1 hypothetical protein PBI_MCFLY_81 [Mycobacterium phage McFly]AMW64430.1 hypothetical protein PBI_KAZAN_82 [Mycobacterium phage Kazan]QDF15862.1 hypothetical protein SEA_KIPPER29_81 [Mycobacterium phage Kipper29]QNL30432.1 hypothetical protein SEA_SUPERCALLIE99_78 [M